MSEFSNPFTCRIEWSGNTHDYDAFPRTNVLTFPRGQQIKGSSASQALDPVVTNPEELLAAAAGMCLMVTFLAVCARARINVLSYEDQPAATVELVDRRYRVTRIALHPTVTIEGIVERERLNMAMEKAHGNCVISLSVKSEVTIEPSFLSA